MPTDDGYYNVKTYGANGDGSTYDDAAVQAALTDAAAVGGRVLFPPGKYRLQQTISLNNNCAGLVGTGGISQTTVTASSDPGSEIYFDPPGGTGTGFVIDGQHSDVHSEKYIADLFIHGPGLTVAGAGAGASLGQNPVTAGGQTFLWDALYAPSEWVIERVVINGFRHGLTIDGDHIHIQNVRSENCYYGVYVTSPTSRQGSNSYLACSFTSNNRASLAIASGGFMNGDALVQVHFGFSPYGLLQEGLSSSHVAIRDTSFVACAWEHCGNGLIFDASQPPTNGAAMRDCVFVANTSANNFNSSYQISGTAADYAVVLNDAQGIRLTGSAESFSSPGKQGIWYLASTLTDFYHDDAGLGVDNCNPTPNTLPLRYFTVGGGNYARVGLRYYGTECRGMSVIGAAVKPGDVCMNSGPDATGPSGSSGVGAIPIGVSLSSANVAEFAVVARSGGVKANIVAATSPVGNGSWMKASNSNIPGTGYATVASGAYDPNVPFGYLEKAITIGDTTATVRLRSLV